MGNPAVSVIIPLYNAEKYIGELLDSILVQTFQDFEVIVIDDCSTDNSRAVVESYVEKFGERLKIEKTLKNSGGPGEPSNTGIYLSRGEYLLILDNDDAIAPTALEELYPVAKKFNADVVACEKYYAVPEKFWNDAEYRSQMEPVSYQNENFVTEPTPIPFDIVERVKACQQGKFLWNIWSKLIRRDFLIKNNIRFDKNMIQDMLLTCCTVYTAERFIRVPNVVNFYRVRDDSLSNKDESPQDFFVRYIRALTSGFKFLDEFLSAREFFLQNPEVKYRALETYVNEVMMYLEKFYEDTSVYAAHDILQREFERGDCSSLSAFILNSEVVHKLLLNETLSKLAESQNQSLLPSLKTNYFPDAFAISVIVPMYNAEKFIGELLNSLLAQTFQDFEVIVVDDCSTDNSVEIVKSYVEKFGGRLSLYQTEKNSGGGGYVPRNIGLELSRGKYIYFADADDFIVETALEILYTAATQYHADVVYTNGFYSYDGNGDFNLKSDLESALIADKGLEDKISLTVDDPNKNLWRLLSINGNLHMPWTKFVERKFLAENEIAFPEINSGGDFVWTIQVMYCAKRFLRLPIALYFYRENSTQSVTRKRRSPQEQITASFKAFLAGARTLQELLNKIRLLKQNPNYFRAAMSVFFNNCFGRTFEERGQLSTQEIYDILYREFGNDLTDSLAVFFFGVADAQQKEFMAIQRRIAELENKE